MRKYVTALLAAPLIMSCADAPTSSLLEPQVSFAANPPPPPVSGITFGTRLTSNETFDATGAALLLATPNNSTLSGDCATNVFDCFPSVFFQNGPGTNAWLEFKKTSNLPHEVAKAYGCSQSPGRIHYNGNTTVGRGCAWIYDGDDIILVLLSQFDQAGNAFNLVRNPQGVFECAAIGDPNGNVAALRISEIPNSERGFQFSATQFFLTSFKFIEPAEELNSFPCSTEQGPVDLIQ